MKLDITSKRLILQNDKTMKPCLVHGYSVDFFNFRADVRNSYKYETNYEALNSLYSYGKLPWAVVISRIFFFLSLYHEPLINVPRSYKKQIFQNISVKF